MSLYNRMKLLWSHIRTDDDLVKEKGPRNEQSSQDRQQTPQPILRAELQIPQSVIERYDASQRGQTVREKRKEYFEVANCIIAIVGLVALIATLYQTRQAVKVATDSIRADKRAWIGIGNIGILNKVAVGESLKIRAGMANSGESPAVHVAVVGYMDFLIRAEGDKRIPLSEDLQYAPCVEPKLIWGDTPGGTIMLPGMNAGTLDRLSPPVPEIFMKMMMRDPAKVVGFQDLTDEDRKEIAVLRTAPDMPPNINKTIGLYFVGCIDYFDTFRIAHRTTFCTQYVYDRSFESDVPRGAFIPCENGNNAD